MPEYNKDCSAASGEVCCSVGKATAGDCKLENGTCRVNCAAGETTLGSNFSECKGSFGLTQYQCCTKSNIPGSGGTKVLKKEGDTCLKKDNDCAEGLVCSGIFFTTCEKGDASAGSSVNSGNTTAPVAPIGGSGTPGYVPSASASGGWSLSSISGFGLPAAPVSKIAGNLLDWLLGILAVAGVIGFIISGIIYLVSTGNETAIDRAKEAMTWSIVGVIVGLSGVIIIQAVDWALNGFGGF